MNKIKKQGNFITNALLLSLGGLFAKILGALYRIPLTNILGSYGMGLYQLVFPPYILFLTICQAGVPVALSKIVAEKSQLNLHDESKKAFKFCFVLLLLLGLFCAVLLASLSSVIAKLQGNSETTIAFVLIAPALLFIPVTNVMKYYFQGKMNMLPSSVTTVIEQIVKLSIGLALATHLMPDVLKAVCGAVIAITASEFCSLVIMSVVYIVHKRKNNDRLPVKLTKSESLGFAKQIFSLAIPVALGAFVMQMSQVVDSVMVVNLLTIEGATSLYGLWTGPVNSMLGLPIALSAGIAISALPSITRTFVSGNSEKLNQSYNSAMKLTLVISVPCSFGLIILSKPIISLLYRGLSPAEIHVSAMLLAISGLSVVFLAMMMTSVSILQAVGKPYVTVLILAFAIVLKAVANLLLLPIPNVNIFGAAVSETLCYLFATTCVIIYLTVKLKMKIQLVGTVLKPLAASLLMTLGLTVLSTFAESFVSTSLGTLFSIAVSALLYGATLFALKVFDDNEMRLLKREKIKA